MNKFYYFFYNKYIKKIINKGKKILIYGKRDFLKIKFCYYISKYIYKKKFLKIFVSKKNYNYSIKFFKSIDSKFIYIINKESIKIILDDYKSSVYKRKSYFNIIYCIEDFKKNKNIFINIIDKNILDYYIFISFSPFSKNCLISSRVYRINLSGLYEIKQNKISIYKEYKKQSILFLKKKIDKNFLINIKKNIKSFLYFFLYYLTSRKNIKTFYLFQIKRIIKSKNVYKTFLLFIKIYFNKNGFLQ
ncbi:hypothetical protein ACWNYQ_00370 [Candidatus Vidania fulgoroideorum]